MKDIGKMLGKHAINGELPCLKSHRKADFKSTQNYKRERLGRQEQTHKTIKDEAIKVKQWDEK